MALTHAKRVHLQATLSPIDLSRAAPGGRRVPDPGRPVVELAAGLLAVAASSADVARARTTVREAHEVAVLDALGRGDIVSLGEALARAGERAEATAHKLTRLLARARLDALEAAEARIDQQLEAAENAWTGAVAASAARELMNREAEQDRVAARVDRALRYAAPAERRRLRDLSLDRLAQDLDQSVKAIEQRLGLPDIPSHEPDPQETAFVQERLRTRLAARGRLAEAPRDARIEELLASPAMPVAAKSALKSAVDSLGIAVDQLGAAKDALAGILEEKPRPVISPIGYLHLERLSYSPAGIEHGELVYSLPLAPGEELSIAHKEWANTSEEFTKLIADQFEDYSERGVVDKIDMAESISAQRSHSTSFNVAVSASGGFGPVSMSTSASFSAQNSESSSRSQSINESQTITKKASARSRKEHRTSFKLAKKTHVEDQTVRRIKNPDPFHPVRFDFFQLLRKWQVDLHRYDVRLTYDLTIPQPAVDLLQVYAEIRALEKQLEQGFDFDVPKVTRLNWREKAEQYGAAIPPPPPLLRSVQVSKVLGPYSSDDPDDDHHDEMRLAVPEGYRYLKRQVYNHYYYRDTEDVFPEIVVNKGYSDNPEATAEIIYGIYADSIRNGFTTVRAWFELMPELEDAWELAAANAIREAATKTYMEQRQILEQRRARLLAELGDVDALTLRKLEREELMKGVLRWLFGPGFDFAPPVSSGYFSPDGSVKTTGTQATVLAHGRIVSFLHQAIEWENINYFLYPYFWTHKGSWDLRLRLRHSDPIHEAFLRAGAARVVLPLRRGWERSFLAFLATGSPAAVLPGNHPYMTIAEEIENFANTNYPGIVPANPEDIDPEAATEIAEGIKIASWYEYTPTSALDIKVGETAPGEGQFVPAAFAPDTLIAHVLPVRDAVVSVLQALATKLSSPS